MKKIEIFKRKSKFEIELVIRRGIIRGDIEVEKVIELIKKTREKFKDADLKIRFFND